MNRREFVKKSSLATAGMMIATRSLSASLEKKRPNVLLVMCDQMRRPRWFPPRARLPHYEKLASSGIEFTHHFTSAVPCSPSRACLFTGRHLDQHGVRINVSKGHQESLDPRIPTLGHLFQQAGYQTPYCGKWHLSWRGDAEDADLSAYGFQKISVPRKKKFTGLNYDEAFTDSALSWLGKPENHKQPWFLTLSLINPHDIGTFPGVDGLPGIKVPRVIDRLPENWDDDLSDKPLCQSQFQDFFDKKAGKMDREDKKVWLRLLDYYYALNRKVDDQLGRVMKLLKEVGALENTLVIFTSDHGEMAGSHKLRGKGPFVYDENTNVPLLMSWPGRIPAGVTSAALCQNVDLFPTLAAILGDDFAGRYSTLPGRSLLPVLADPRVEITDHVLYSFAGSLSMMLMKEDDEDEEEEINAPQNIRSLRERDWVFARYFNPGQAGEEFELYDLKHDPLQMENLASSPQHQDKMKELMDKLKRAQATEMAPGRIK